MLASHGKRVLLYVAGLALILAACAQPGFLPGTGNEATLSLVATEPEAAIDVLANSEWTLVSFGVPGAETPVIEDSNVTLAFEAENRAGGNAGCNTYGGSYTVEGDTLSFHDLVRTLMACQDQAIMQQEDRYLEALDAAGKFEISGDRLRIAYGDGQETLNFVRKTAAPTVPVPTPATTEAAPPSLTQTCSHRGGRGLSWGWFNRSLSLPGRSQHPERPGSFLYQRHQSQRVYAGLLLLEGPGQLARYVRPVQGGL